MRHDQIEEIISQLYPDATWVEVMRMATHRGDTSAEGQIYFGSSTTKEFSIKISLDIKEEL